MTRYYFPINSVTLADYLGCACIKPTKYFEKRQGDLQDKFPESLVLTTNFGSRETDCCLELCLTGNEKKRLQPIGKGWFLCETPLPITRIKKILFSSEEQRNQTIENIRMSTAFVPNELIKVVDKFDNFSLDKIEAKPNNNTFERSIRKFDSYLGGFSLMRLACEEYMNYSENYFSTLSFFSDKIRKELETNKQRISDKYFDAFLGKQGFKKLLPLINKKINEQDLNILAEEEGQKISKNIITGLIDLLNLEKNTLIAAVLYTYKVGDESGNKKIDSLILNNFKGVEKGEGIAFCYGLNRGYSIFSSKYKDKNVKFQLNSQLDYYTIESLYQYAFNGIKSNNFPYLDDWCPKQKTSSIIGKTDYKILDIVVIGKKKAKLLSPEYLENLLLQFFQKDSTFLFKGLFEKMRETIYNDTKDEITNDYENKIVQKQEEIENLKTERDKLLNTQTATLPKEYNLEGGKIFTISGLQSEYCTKQNYKELLDILFKEPDKFKTKAELKKEAKQKKIMLTKDCNLIEIVEKLITTKTPIDNSIFRNEQNI